MDLQTLFYYFVIYAFLGWVGEVLFAYYVHHKFVNRGFLHGPFCPIYGVGAVLVYIVAYYLGGLYGGVGQMSLIVEFFYVMLITTALEFVTGYVLEKIFHTKWWDYSELPFNVKGYICLRFSVLWGIVGVIVLNTFQKVVGNFVSEVPPKFGDVASSVLLIYFAIDIIVTLRELVDYRHLVVEIEEKTQALQKKLEAEKVALKDQHLKRKENFEVSLEEKRQALNEKLERNRWVKAFPTMHLRVKKIDLDKLKKSIEKHDVLGVFDKNQKDKKDDERD